MVSNGANHQSIDIKTHVLIMIFFFISSFFQYGIVLLKQRCIFFWFGIISSDCNFTLSFLVDQAKCLLLGLCLQCLFSLFFLSFILAAV